MDISRQQVFNCGNYFVKKYSYLRTSDGACNRCGEFSRHIVRTLDFESKRKFRKPTRAHVLLLTKPRLKFERRHVYHKRNPKIFSHCVVRIGDWCLDVTRRQLDPRSPHPFVQHINAVRKDWTSVKRMKWKP